MTPTSMRPTGSNAFTFLVPIFGLAIGATLFDERLAWIQAAGVVLVLAGIFLVQRDARDWVRLGRRRLARQRRTGSGRSPFGDRPGGYP